MPRTRWPTGTHARARTSTWTRLRTRTRRKRNGTTESPSGVVIVINIREIVLRQFKPHFSSTIIGYFGRIVSDRFQKDADLLSDRIWTDRIFKWQKSLFWSNLNSYILKRPKHKLNWDGRLTGRPPCPICGWAPDWRVRQGAKSLLVYQCNCVNQLGFRSNKTTITCNFDHKNFPFP